MASELRVNTLKDAAGNNSIATSFVAGGSAKAWHKGNAAGTSLLDSLNVSSLGDTGTGVQTINLSSAMNNAFYSGHSTVMDNATYIGMITGPTTSLYISRMRNTSATLVDAIQGTAIHGDLA